MGLSALMVIEYKEKYYKYISMLAQGHTSIGKMAKELNVDRNTLYNWSRRECFAEDLADANRGLLAFHCQVVRNANMNMAKQGEAQNIKLFWQKELGWTEKTEVKNEIINADALVAGILEAKKKME